MMYLIEYAIKLKIMLNKLLSIEYNSNPIY